MFKSQEKLIAEIHNEFDTAQERLLEQANQLLASLSVPTESKIEGIASRLERVGFTATPSIRRAENLKRRRQEVQETLVSSKEQADLINYYKFNYPFLKFLTEDELKRICDKYGLIHAPVGNYIKEVPEKNLRDIEVAQELRATDTVEDVMYFKSYSDQGDMDKFLQKLGLQNGEITKSDLRRVMNNSPYIRGYNMVDYYLDRVVDNNTWLFCISYHDYRDGTGRTWNYEGVQVQLKKDLFIAAPKSHFNLKGLDKKSKHGFFSVLKTEVKDPIVFRYVRGGVQVLTCWGLEGEDPMLYNEKMN